MSRFETSKFVRDSSIMHQNVLVEACQSLGWKYHVENNSLLITDLGNNVNFFGEYAIKVTDNQVTYNTYYFGETEGAVKQLQNRCLIKQIYLKL